MTRHRLRLGMWPLVAATALALEVAAPPRGAAQDCNALLGPLQQGLSSAEIAQMTGLSTFDVELCRRALSQPIMVGPAGAPPSGAVGSPPRGAAGPPPRNAPGPPPFGAPGPPPVAHDLKRLP